MKPLFQPFYCVIFFIRCEFMVQLVYPSKKGISDIIASAHQNHALSVPVDMEQPVLFGGDNFVALSSLIQSGYEGKIDLVYIDPPYNTNQIFTVPIRYSPLKPTEPAPSAAVKTAIRLIGTMRRAKRSMAKRAVNGGGCCRLKAGIGEARPQNWIFWTGKV